MTRFPQRRVPRVTFQRRTSFRSMPATTVGPPRIASCSRTPAWNNERIAAWAAVVDEATDCGVANFALGGRSGAGSEQTTDG